MATGGGLDDVARAVNVRPLLLATFVSALDRFSVAPMLVVIGRDLNVSLGSASAAASVYFLCYGLSQAGWGPVSDRFGRVRTMRFTLILGAVAGLASAVAPTLLLLAVARALAGTAFAAVTPGSLVYIGDSMPFTQRRGPLNKLVAANASGTAVAIIGGGFAASFASWRIAFAIPAVLAIWLAVMFGSLAEPTRQGLRRGAVRQFTMVLQRPWALLVIGIGFAEGAVVLGLLTYLATALETAGVGAALAGTVVAVFGGAVLAMSRVSSRLGRRRRMSTVMGIGGAGYAIAYYTIAFGQPVLGVLACSLVLGTGWALMHPLVQSWATEVVPEARASAVSLYAMALFVGSAVSAAIAAPLAEAHRFGTIFVSAALLATLLTVVTVIGRRRYAGD
ncbi:MAG TPA: MFS transporter [Candidatus Dormibacteraeota bacterium]